MPLLIAIILALTGTGTVAVSQNSVPGDTLYPVKTLVEKVETATAFSDARRADLEVAFTKERVREMNQLLDRVKQGGEDSTKTAEKLKTAAEVLSAQITDTRDQITSLKNSGDTTHADEATKELEQTLKESRDGFDGRSREHDGEIKNQIDNAISVLDNESEADGSSTDSNADIENGESSTTVAWTKDEALTHFTKALNTLQEFRNFLQVRMGVTLASVAQAIDEKLKESDKYLLKGKMAVDAGDYKKAIESFNESLRSTEEARALLSGNSVREAPKPGTLPTAGEKKEELRGSPGGVTDPGSAPNNKESND